jgi:transcriptional regulator with XRE-family HTH domain
VKNDVSERIRILRLSKNLSQQNLADELDITVAAYSNIERGKADITITRLYKIAKIFGMDVLEILSTRDILRETADPYGFASKRDLDNLSAQLRAHQKELNQLKKEIALIKKQKSAVTIKKKK